MLFYMLCFTFFLELTFELSGTVVIPKNKYELNTKTLSLTS